MVDLEELYSVEDQDLIEQLIRKVKVRIETPEQTFARRRLERKRDIINLFYGRHDIWIIPNLNEMALGRAWMEGENVSDEDSARPTIQKLERFDAIYAILKDGSFEDQGGIAQDVRLDAQGRTALFYAVNPRCRYPLNGCDPLSLSERENADDPLMLEAVLETGIDPTLTDINGKTALDGADEDMVRCVMHYTMKNRPDVWSRPGVADWFYSLLPAISKYNAQEI